MREKKSSQIGIVVEESAQGVSFLEDARCAVFPKVSEKPIAA